MLGVEVEDILIANGRARGGSEAGSIVGVSSSEVVRSMRRICFCSVYEDIFIFLVEGVFLCVKVRNTCCRLKCCFDFWAEEEKKVPLITLNLSACGQVGEEIESYMNCLIENIENFDNCSVKG